MVGFAGARDGMEDRIGELTSYDRGHLHDPLEVVLNPVHSCGDDTLDRIGDLDFGRLQGEDVLPETDQVGSTFIAPTSLWTFSGQGPPACIVFERNKAFSGPTMYAQAASSTPQTRRPRK